MCGEVRVAELAVVDPGNAVEIASQARCCANALDAVSDHLLDAVLRVVGIEGNASAGGLHEAAVCHAALGAGDVQITSRLAGC